MRGQFVIPVLASILIMGTLALSPNASAAQGTITFINPAEKHGMIQEDGCEGTNGECQYQFQIPGGLTDPNYHPQEGDSVTFTVGPGQKATGVTQVVEPPGEGLIAHWNFDEGQDNTLNDVSGNGKNGDVVGATWVSGTSCKSGSCLDFNGFTNHVNLPTIGIASENDPYTVSAWIKVRHNNIPESKIIIGNNDLSAPYINQYGTAMSATTDDRLAFGFGKSQIWTVDIRSDGVPIVDTLHHVAATYDGSKSVNGMKIYIDGIQPNFFITSLQDPEGDFGEPSVPIDNWYIGKFDGTSFFDGIIDEVRIYDRALTDAEILRLFQS